MSIQETNPDLWLFFENSNSYTQDAKEDLDCRKWQDTLKVADFIRLTNTDKFNCSQDLMTTSYSEEYSDHNSEDGVDFFLNRATRISKEQYDALRESNRNISEKERDLLEHKFANVFYLNSRRALLKDDFLVINPVKYSSLYLYQIAVLAQLKDVEDYFLFEFNR